MEPNVQEAITIYQDLYWVGYVEKQTRLTCNAYLLMDHDEGVVIDPGSIPDFPGIMRKILDITDPRKISHIVVSHQDPDVCGNLPVMEDIISNPRLRIAAHINTIRLIQHYGLKSDLLAVNDCNYRIVLRSGRVLEFMFVPFLHSPGAIMTFDRSTGTLFSGDIFGGLSEKWSLYADDSFLEGMKAFHQAYISSNAILRACMDRVERLPLKRILPQHGSVITGKNVEVAIAYLRELPCACDLNNDWRSENEK